MRKLKITNPADSDGPLVVRHYDLNGVLVARHEIAPGTNQVIEGEAGLRLEMATPVVVAPAPVAEPPVVA
jgi:hypothetical protein